MHLYGVLPVALQRSLLDFSCNLGYINKNNKVQQNATVSQRKSLTVACQAIVIIMTNVVIMVVVALMAIVIIMTAVIFFLEQSISKEKHTMLIFQQRRTSWRQKCPCATGMHVHDEEQFILVYELSSQLSGFHPQNASLARIGASVALVMAEV